MPFRIVGPHKKQVVKCPIHCFEVAKKDRRQIRVNPNPVV
jgi:hypothetical protein